MQLPLQHTPLATCLSTRCVDGKGSSLIPTVWNKEFTESAQDYMSRTNRSVKVLDFVQLGGLAGSVAPCFIAHFAGPLGASNSPGSAQVLQDFF